eukprot:TRINITY_DN17526_c0_g1_i3.p1 TRINITY_DN17526_c0_g1~~TRINITY_DN17526_c0_g1_i3.p1  ORF type:complete len:129 (+),score=22.17 TRINITY_DN17526_c0_g1_i3:243-629(+)
MTAHLMRATLPITTATRRYCSAAIREVSVRWPGGTSSSQSDILRSLFNSKMSQEIAMQTLTSPQDAIQKNVISSADVGKHELGEERFHPGEYGVVEHPHVGGVEAWTCCHGVDHDMAGCQIRNTSSED